jgi:Mor family transcriptional regulator
MLNIAELTLFFSKLKRGIYGTLYGRFDGMMICSAAREYRMSRGRVFASLPSDEQKKLTM